MRRFLPLLLLLGVANAQSGVQGLLPPFLDVALGRPIHASATCGETGDGGENTEVYCNLVGATSKDQSLIGGQFCGSCEKGQHSAKYALDGTSTSWWQSPSLARGNQFHQVNITIDLEQVFEVYYVLVRMANSPRPKVFALERSSDNGKTFHAWQYFASSKIECELYFGPSATCQIGQTRIIPLENGEIYINIRQASSLDFQKSAKFQAFTRATHVRLRFLKMNTLQGHLSSLENREPSVTRRYFYSIKDIEIGGRCACNGHAESCTPAAENPKELRCVCENNTCGAQCETCCPGYNGYPNCRKNSYPNHVLGRWLYSH